MKLQFTYESLNRYFQRLVHESVENETGVLANEATEQYLADLLARFAAFEKLYAIRNAQGSSVSTVAEMVSEGDIRDRAESFAREREVHKHLGDYLLFWSGMYPEYFRQLRREGHIDGLLDPLTQGRASYTIASSYRHEPYRTESDVLQRLGDEFEGYVQTFRGVRKRLN